MKQALKALFDRVYLAPFRSGETVALMLIGHMRCGSTLLSHILQQNPQVLGWGERHMIYRTQAEVDHIVRSTALESGVWRLRNHVVFDKVVNEMFSIEPALLTAPNTRALFLLRKPEPTLSSILRVLGDAEGWTRDDAFAHYRTRMEQMQVFAQTIDDPRRATVLTHDQLLHETDAVFDLLSVALDLDQPLTEKYETTERTGTWGWGDTSARIHTGRIVRNERPIEHDVPRDMLDEATVLYEDTLDVLRHHALCLPAEEAALAA